MNPDPGNDRTIRGLVLGAIAVPVGLLLLVPLVLLIAAWFYLSACKEGLMLLFRAAIGGKAAGDTTTVIPAPHFNEARREVPASKRD